MTTRAPTRASANEMARPTRTAPPVTSAVRPRSWFPPSGASALSDGHILLFLREDLQVRGVPRIDARLRVQEVHRVVHRDRRFAIPGRDQLQLAGILHHVTRRINARQVRLHE